MTTQGRLHKKITRLLGQLGWPRWLHHFGPKKYEVRQHLLVVLVWSSTTMGFRRAVALLRGLGFAVPTFTAVIKWLGRLPTWQRRRLLAATAGAAFVAVAAIDSTGFALRERSPHYARRIDGKQLRIPVKWTILISTRTRKILATRARMRPAHDVRDVDIVLDRCRAPVRKLVADKGYDSEKVHASCARRGIISIIPSRRGVHRGRYRHRMRDFFKPRVYHRRETVECTIGVVKRRGGGSVRCRKVRTVRAELDFRAIAHNLKVLLLNSTFSSRPSPA